MEYLLAHPEEVTAHPSFARVSGSVRRFASVRLWGARSLARLLARLGSYRHPHQHAGHCCCF